MSSPGFAPVTAPRSPYGSSSAVLEQPTTDAPGGDLRDPVDPQVFVNDYTRPLPSYAETFSSPGYESKPMPTSGFAVAGLVCGIVGVFTLFPALLAIAFGHLGIWQTSRNTHAGRGLAVGAIVLGYAVAGVVALVVFAMWIVGL